MLEDSDSVFYDNSSEKIAELSSEFDWSEDINNLLNSNIWTNTVPIEVLYQNNSSDSLEHQNIKTNDDIENFLNGNKKKNKSQGLDDKNKQNSGLNVDFESSENIITTEEKKLKTNNNKNIKNMNYSINAFNRNFNNDNKNESSLIFGDKTDYKNAEISDWLKEQTTNDQNRLGYKNDHLRTDIEFYGNFTVNTDNNPFNFLNSPSTYRSSLPNTSSPSVITSSQNSNAYNSPLTCVLLSSSFYAKSPTNQPPPKTPIALTTEFSHAEKEKTETSKRDKSGLQSVTGENSFDPSKRAFSIDELKVSQIVPKSQKKFVPNDKKDSSYWSKRIKNNKAAKKSREAKRMKENQINLRTAFLEEENNRLKNDVTKLIAENKHLRLRLSKYEI